MNGAAELGAAFSRVLERQGGGMDLQALLPERMLIESTAGQRLRAALANVSEGAYTAATRELASAFSGGMVNGSAGYRLQGGVAIIDVRGTLSKKFSLWGLIFGGSASTEYILSGLNAALEDEAVKRVLFVIDSPGGDIAGIDELADAIYAAREKKPVVALGADRCMSGGYWLACQAERFFVTANAMVGSIGVRFEYASDERLELNVGIDRRSFASTPAKLRAPDVAVQQNVDDIAANFIAAVARGRGIETSAAEELADALVYVGQRAVARGLADGVTTLQALIGQLQAEIEQPPAVALDAEIEPPCEDTTGGTDTGAERPANDTRAEEVAPLTAAHKEDEMSDTPPNVEALVQRLDALESKAKASDNELAALRAENEALKAKADATASTVAAVTSDRDADRLVAELRGELSGPVRLAAQDEDGEKVVRDRVAAKGLEESRDYFTRTLSVLGKGEGSVVAAAGGQGGGKPAVRHRFDVFGPEKWAASSDPKLVAYGRKIEWIDATEKAGRQFKTAAEAFAAYDAAHRAA